MIYKTLRADLKTAMKNRAPITGYIKLVISELDRIAKNVKPSELVDGHLTDERCLQEIKKLYKNAVDMSELGEAKYIKKFIPTQMGKEEIESIMASFTLTDYPKNLNIGAIMKHFNMNYRGKVDNKLVSEIAKKLLT